MSTRTDAARLDRRRGVQADRPLGTPGDLQGLWVWETTWPVALRLLLVIGIGGWNLLVFLPRALAGRP